MAFGTQDSADEVVPERSTNRLVRHLCRQGDTVDYKVYPGLSHTVIGYESAPDALAWMQSILAGDTQFGIPIGSTAIPQIKGGKVRALAVTSGQRIPALPDVPTLVEIFNAPDLALDAWFGIWAPAGTPPASLDILNKALARTYDDPVLRADSEATGAFVTLTSSPAEFTRFMEAETRKFEKIVKAANLTVDK